MKLTLDVETFSRADLKSAGLHAYAEHESTDLLCVCWAFDDGPVSAWVPSADLAFLNELSGFGTKYGGPEVPKELLQSLARGDVLHAWNASFERAILNGPAGKRYGFPKLEISQMRCSMARARACSLPGSLQDAANALNAAVKKRMDGVNAMRYLCKPRKDGTRPTIADERERFLELVAYCADDVRAERAVDDMLPELSPKEQKVWELDQKINDRGVKVDLKAIDDMEALIDAYKADLKEKCLKVTGVAPTQAAKLADWIRNNGWPQLENLQAGTIRELVARDDVPINVKTILKLYSTYNIKAVAKYPAIREAVCKDGRLRGMLMFHGAGTGRWSSMLVQIHNLFRPVIDDQDAAIAAAAARDLDWIRALYPGIDPMKVISSCVRGMLVAEEGCELVFPDFSGIENRGNAWLWQETWKLEAYRRGEDLYVAAIARALGIAPADVSKSQRQLGKVLELSMGYGGGVGAFVKMAKAYGIDLNTLVPAYEGFSYEVKAECEVNYARAIDQGRIYGRSPEVWRACEGLKILWRQAHPRIVAGWKQLNDAACNAVANPGEIHSVADKRVMFKVEGDFLVMRLPSGRKIRYFQPQLDASGLTYMGVDTETRQWQRTRTYGGKLCENTIQGLCRDLLVDALLRFDTEGHASVFHVHDEPVLEAPLGRLPESVVSRIMVSSEKWAEGLPVDLEGHRGQRYRK